MDRKIKILFLFTFSLALVLPGNTSLVAQGIGETIMIVPPIVKDIKLVTNQECDKTLEEVRTTWGQLEVLTPNQLGRQLEIIDHNLCTWSHVLAVNPSSEPIERVLYFPKTWPHLECHQLTSEGTFIVQKIGSEEKSEVLNVRIEPGDSLEIYVKYPEPNEVIFPMFTVREFTTREFEVEESKAIIKDYLIGAMLFAFFFFMAQFAIQRDSLSFYYLIFLIGSGSHLVDILDTVPTFELAPKIMTKRWVLQLVFLWSTLLTLGGLTKFIHVFLNVSSWSINLKKVGDSLIIIFTIVVLIPMLFSDLLLRENYEGYLLYFRLSAIVLLLYILAVCLTSWLKKVKFSRVLLVAFLPFLLSAIWYALSFLIEGGLIWLGTESVILIIGFVTTLLLFGVLLGVRSNAIKKEKIIIEERAGQLQELSKAKNRFYTNITHEFRTPLTVIKGMADQIKGQDNTRRLIRQNSDRLLSMVTQLLDLSKLETNSMTPNFQLGDIIPYLQYITESCHSLALQKRINLSYFSKEDSLQMDFDEEIMQQILTNLLSNAIKFTPEYGSVKVITAVESREEKSYLKISVTDTGRGIADHQIDHIFDRYFRVDDQDVPSHPTHTEKHYSEGSGIGLALVKELVSLLKGKIEVESILGKGSQFHIYLPIHKRATLRTESSAWRYSPVLPEQSKDNDSLHISSVPNQSLPKLLIIEDNFDVIEYIQICLRNQYEVHTATNGLQGVEKALKMIPDVILSDVMMPEMDGFTVCNQLKSDRRTSHIPIILLTAKATQQDKIIGLSHGADAYLIKPFDKEELQVRLKNLTLLSKKLQEHLVQGTALSEQFHDQAQLEASFLQEVNKIIDTQMSNEMFDTQFLCREMTMSRTQLHRKLKALTDKSTAQYIRIRKMQQARILLETTDIPIGEIAADLGFKDFSHFSRSFAQIYGGTPSSFRKK